MEQHEAKALARTIRCKADLYGGNDVDVEWILVLISFPLVIIGLVSMVFEILTGLLVWKILMVMGTIIGGIAFYALIFSAGYSSGVNQAAEIAECTARYIKDDVHKA